MSIDKRSKKPNQNNRNNSNKKNNQNNKNNKNNNINQNNSINNIKYIYPVYRPPSESNSLLIPATNGCTHKCTFCAMYRTKTFKIRELSEIKQDIQIGKKIFGKNVKKIFLLDGNAFVMKSNDLIEITKFCFKIHKYLKRVSAYAHVRDILNKTDEELKKISEAGLKMLYIGIESGSNEVLKLIKKGCTANQIAEAAQKCHKAGITWSGIFLLGLAGKDPILSKKHAIESGKLINQMAPLEDIDWYISPLSLNIYQGTPIAEMERKGEFLRCSSKEILNELNLMIENIDSSRVKNCIFNTNHASNYLSLKGVLSRDKEEFLKKIKYGLNHPESLRPEYLRGG